MIYLYFFCSEQTYDFYLFGYIHDIIVFSINCLPAFFVNSRRNPISIRIIKLRIYFWDLLCEIFSFVYYTVLKDYFLRWLQSEWNRFRMFSYISFFGTWKFSKMWILPHCILINNNFIQFRKRIRFETNRN